MKKSKTRPKYSIITNVRILILIYALLCVITVLFSRNFFSNILRDGQMPDRLNLIVFFTIPGALLVFLGASLAGLVADIIARRPGSKFKARLLAYFIVIALFAALPVTFITGLSAVEVVRFWRGVDGAAAIAAGRNFAVDNYAFNVERFDNILKETNFSRLPPGGSLPAGIAAVQEFESANGGWKETAFSGGENSRLPLPPATEQGYVFRELPRDSGLVRYVQTIDGNRLRLISYALGEDFDLGLAAIENQGAQFEVIDSLWGNLRPLILFYCIVFFFPTLLMTVIIAISFTRRVTHPIVELTDATRRVAEGDFSIQILARRGDELGLLIRSFNAMVQDLEKSRSALVKAEKISIWQNMAQQLAHEIKNPLTPIKLSAERTLRRWRNEPERIGEILENSMMAIIQETEGLSTLLTEFRTLSRPMEPSRSWTALRETVGEIIGLYRSSYPEVRFDIEHVADNMAVKIDKNRLSQVLTNLVINAIDAMNGKGAIEIRSDLVKKREIRYCRLSIKDTGKGIGKQEGPLVFTPYFTTKESGTGLGLPIVERIVNDHGGAIWFNSAEGMGTTFFIDLLVNEQEFSAEGSPAVADAERA
ncbi:MAG: HAMP domain-containing protein [Treponema sp.]|jgi:nitrogen fixation/metabolism regulation signal transduction histidine kinase|nr:HAMP domain-containing protein [Treponema sp.]